MARDELYWTMITQAVWEARTDPAQAVQTLGRLVRESADPHTADHIVRNLCTILILGG